MTFFSSIVLTVGLLALAGVFNWWAKKQVKSMPTPETTIGISVYGKHPKSSTPLLTIWEQK